MILIFKDSYLCVLLRLDLVIQPSRLKKFILYSTEHEILNARQYKIIKKFSIFKAKASLDL